MHTSDSNNQWRMSQRDENARYSINRDIVGLTDNISNIHAREAPAPVFARF